MIKNFGDLVFALVVIAMVLIWIIGVLTGHW
jgi:hypothetical protein